MEDRCHGKANAGYDVIICNDESGVALNARSYRRTKVMQHNIV